MTQEDYQLRGEVAKLRERVEALERELETAKSFLGVVSRGFVLREDAVFARGFRAGFCGGYKTADGAEVTPFQSEVDAAHARWMEDGRMTHLDEES